MSDEIIPKKRRIDKKLRDEIEAAIINTKDGDLRRLAFVTRSILKTVSDQYEIIYELQNKMTDQQKTINRLDSNKET
jgi:hypothetical protein